MAKKEKSKKQKLKSASSAAELSDNQVPNAANDLFRSIKEVGVVKALKNAKDGIADLLSNTDLKLATTLATVYAAAIIVQEDDDEWSALCEAKEWIDHPKAKPKRDDPLRAAVRLAVGFDGPKSNSTVNRYITALQPLFEQEVPAAEIPDRIREAGGIEKLRQASKPAPKPEIRFNMAPISKRKIFNVAEETEFKARIRIKPITEGISWAYVSRLVPRKPKQK